MIRSFRHKGLEKFFLTGSKAGVVAAHSGKLQLVLTALNAAKRPEHLNAPMLSLHPLRGDLDGYWSVSVNGNWRVIFRFLGEDVELVDYLDYH